MSFGAPPSKAEQEAESKEQRTAVDLGTNQPDQAPEIIGEDTRPAPAPAPAPAEAAAEETPAEPTAAPNPRDDIAKRYHERRKKEREQYIAHEAETTPLFLQGEPEATPEAQPVVAAPAPEAKTYDVKVNGQTAKVSREQLLAMADLSAEDADGLPDSTLIKSAQITEAARRRLENAKTTTFGTAPVLAAPAATPATTQEPNAEQNSSRNEGGTPTLAEAVEKIQYGNAEEAAAAFNAAIELKFAERKAAERMDEVQADQDKAIVEFSQKFSDVNSLEEATPYVLGQTTEEVIKDLRKLGVPDAELMPLRTNPALAYKAHRMARANGLDVRTPAEILETTGNAARKLFGLQRETSPQPSPAPVATQNSRVEAKRALSQQPQRSGTSVATAAPAPETTRSSTIMKMRAARGQPVA